MEFIELKFIASVLTGYPFKSNLYGNEGTRTVRGENITEGKLRWDSIKCWNEPFDKKDFYSLKSDDIVIGMDGSKVGKNKARIFEEDLPLLLAQRVACLRTNEKADQVYLYYCINNPRFEEYVFRIQTGSSVPHISKTQIENFQIPIPSLGTQKQIAKVLSDLDAKIEVNNKINAALEALAKTIYDYWFVQFDFPCPEALEGQEHLAGKPYKSSGGKMVYNEELKREIPEGWEVKELNELLEVGKEQVNPASNPEKEFKHISIPVFDSTETYGIEKGNEIASSKFVVTEYDIAVSKLNPWFNRVFYPLDEQDLICTTEMVVWKCKEIKKKNFFFELAKSQHFIAYSTQNATGTSNSHKRVNPTIMMKYKLPYSKEQIEKFGDLVNPWIKKVMSNKKENQKLAALRDWLLPMLMNGQVTVEKKEDQEVDLNLAGESAGTFKTK
jgi:type I restriction enzyme S subunit